MEAWTEEEKPNLTYSHAWGATPADIIPRFLVGATPMTPGWYTARLKPQPGGLPQFNSSVPTPRGQIRLQFQQVRRMRELGVVKALVSPAPFENSKAVTLAHSHALWFFRASRPPPRSPPMSRWRLMCPATCNSRSGFGASQVPIP